MITSPANERLKHARRVRDGREDLIFVEGERLIEECLLSGLALAACFHSPEPSPRAQTILAELADRGCPLLPTADAVLATISDTVNSQGLIVLAERPTATIEQVLSSSSATARSLVVCLDAVQDPGNFGTILRTAEAAGASGVIALKGSVDPFAPKTLRSAMGSAFRLPIATDVSPEELLAKARAAGLKIVATAAEGKNVYSNFDWRQPAVIVLGNEANGVRQELLEKCDEQISIPLNGAVESLNVAAAAAVILFEAARQKSANKI
ncbi:MAG: TrmH family RNA methyltransferase [Blastocatellia bacterium]